jgi:hypothetical protein
MSEKDSPQFNEKNISHGADIHHLLFERRAKRRFNLNRLRPRDNNPLAAGEIPLSLSNPSGFIDEPGRRIYKFDGLVATLNFDGGAIITTARLVPLFWGEYWKTAIAPSPGDIQQAITDILASPYLSEVKQYGFEGLSQDPGMIVISPGPPSPTYSGNDVKDMVWDLIDDDKFPEPDDDGGRIVYMVFAPPGTNYNVDIAAGAHGQADDFDLPFDLDTAWVGWCNFGTLDNIMEIFTHELVEILTDPEPTSGWTVNGMPDGENEIVDMCFNQTGMVSGYRVSAYYSDRLKACVVPTFPHQFMLSVATKKEQIGQPFGEGIGITATTKHSICFEGTYEWRLINQKQRITFTATPMGYVEPEFEWKINGHSISNFGSVGAATQSVTTPASIALDPLSMITTLPARTVTAKAAAGNNVLILESQPGEPAGDFEVVCTVTEKHLPKGYHTAREDSRAITVTGSVRVMDERFQKDLAECIYLKSVLARALVEEVVVPKIDKGDPPKVWIEPVLNEPETEIGQQVNKARFLAHVVEESDPELAGTLQHLADGVMAVTYAINFTEITGTK